MLGAGALKMRRVALELVSLIHTVFNQKFSPTFSAYAEMCSIVNMDGDTRREAWALWQVRGD